MTTVDERLQLLEASTKRLEKSQKRYRLVPIIVVVLIQIMVGNVRAEIVQGDFDGNGVVDFSDFLVFAGNFGKTGDKFDPNNPNIAMVYDTVKVYVEELQTVQPAEDGIIEGLTHLEGYASKDNWDADAENDGLKINLYLGGANSYSMPEEQQAIIIDVIVKVYVRIYDSNYNTIPGELVYEQKHTGTIKSLIYTNNVKNIPREKLEPFDDRNFYTTFTLVTPKQGNFETFDTFALKENPNDTRK